MLFVPHVTTVPHCPRHVSHLVTHLLLHVIHRLKKCPLTPTARFLLIWHFKSTFLYVKRWSFASHSCQLSCCTVQQNLLSLFIYVFFCFLLRSSFSLHTSSFHSSTFFSGYRLLFRFLPLLRGTIEMSLNRVPLTVPETYLVIYMSLFKWNFILHITFLQFVYLKAGIDWIVPSSAVICPFIFISLLKVLCLSLSLGDLSESGVRHNICHRREWRERRLPCLICKRVLFLFLHLIGLCITTDHSFVFFSLLFFYLLCVCCWSTKHLLLYMHSVCCLFLDCPNLSKFHSYCNPSVFSLHECLNTSQLRFSYCVNLVGKCWPVMKQWTVHL